MDPRQDDSKLGKVITAERAYKIDEASNRLPGFAQSSLRPVRKDAPNQRQRCIPAGRHRRADVRWANVYEHDASGALPGSAVGESTLYLHNLLGHGRSKASRNRINTADPTPAIQIGFVAWLQSRFAAVWQHAQERQDQLGIAYVYGEQGQLLGEYGMAAPPPTVEYIWLPHSSSAAGR
jgi:hypothetical protein